MADEPELQKGQSSDWAQYLQQLLQHLGYWNGTADGTFGDDVEHAVKQFQTAYGLTADGVVRADTWAALTGGSAGAGHTGGHDAAHGGGSATGAGGAQSTDPNDRVLEVNWAADFPELHALATVSDFEDYVRHVVGVDPSELQSETQPSVA
jgi:peptidoglycan hydrolase-like protein with peptidoglycan-binding domain